MLMTFDPAYMLFRKVYCHCCVTLFDNKTLNVSFQKILKKTAALVFMYLRGPDLSLDSLCPRPPTPPQVRLAFSTSSHSRC